MQLIDGAAADINPDAAAHLSPVRLMSSSSRFNRAVARRVETSAAAGTWRALAALDELGPTRVSDLAEWQRVSQPTMTTLVRRMEQEGLVQREPDPGDGRASLVSITEEGRHQFEVFRAQAIEVTAPAWGRLSDSDRAVLVRAAELLAALLEEPELR
ncbi:MarR family winged helix-turn-helix transcriptional regulator [Microbacterium sp. cf332]|uniref:MarR family winged helix-turn-helix transcriptional regulator n=1 Tax=Microbacterium sp. cf332 TaxID=1761804 RepID=UPI00088CD633|nr:MarR family transcriptional regulator [Microbacterium sp. cf332]SDQ90706.1 DNA-binding transcriptional regulator, MarR family [Microbacterium sp. cf332]